MGKKKTLKKAKNSSSEITFVKLKPGVKTSKWSPTKDILNQDKIKDALFLSLVTSDIDAFKEILTAHLEAKVKTKEALHKGLAVRTMFDALSKKGNPRLTTVAKLFEMAFAA